MENQELMEKVVSLAKRRGFIFPNSEIYGGFAGFFDYGPLGLALKNNIKNSWWNKFVASREDVFGVDACLVTPHNVLKASGHVEGFSDPLVECEKCKNKFRADQLSEKKCPSCGGKLGEVRQFNMMFETKVGASSSAEIAYLRPETAQGIFTNFKNVMDSIHPKLPFGIAQIGKAFRNEISPQNFIFRLRELEQMEVEYFVRPEEWKEAFEEWRNTVLEWILEIGLSKDKVHELEVSDADRAHYSKRTIDFEYDFPFGRKELYGLAYRTDYDLGRHQEESGVNLMYMDDESGKKFIPHVIEPSLGVDRTILAVLLDSYREDEMGGEKRVYLKLAPALAPYKVAIFPLLKNKPELIKKAREVFSMIKKEIPQVVFDDNGNIGKRYRRQDEVGTPYCVTIDFDTLENNTVTLRDRDTGKQERVEINKLLNSLK